MDDSFFHKEGDPYHVCMNVVVLSLADIDTQSLSYRMRLELWVAWPLTRKEVNSYIEDKKNWEPLIHPDPVPWTISIEEINKMPFLSGSTTQVFLWRNKIVACECTLVTARYLETMELEMFPFDCQHFNFHIGLRCDCDIPLKVKHDKIYWNTLESIDGFMNFDGRAMYRLKLHESGCTFNVRTHLLVLQDFLLRGIECEIENMEFDIPFLHCSLKMSRRYNPYIYRIFLPLLLIMLNSTLALKFDANKLDVRLTYIITNMLTIVAFLFILSNSLPNIPYLTLIDKYINACFLYICGIGAICYSFHASEVEGTDEETNTFIGLITSLIISHIFLVVYIFFAHRRELQKIFMDRHQVEEYQKSMMGEDKYEKDKSEFLVHTDIHRKSAETNVYQGSLRKYIKPKEAAGWLFDGEGSLDYGLTRTRSRSKSLFPSVKKRLNVRKSSAPVPAFEENPDVEMNPMRKLSIDTTPKDREF